MASEKIPSTPDASPFEGSPAPHQERIAELESLLRARDETILTLNERIASLEAEFEKTALTDDMTGLYNRAGLKKTAAIVMPPESRGNEFENRRATTERKAREIAMLYADIDRFKEINDRYGHAEGNRIIKEAAAFLAGTVRPSDIVSRLHGDEFAVLFNGNGDRVINKFFDPEADPPRPRLGFDTTISEEGGDPRPFHVALSGGIAILRPGETLEDFEELLNRADRALYESKKAGRDRISLFMDEPEASPARSDANG